MDNVKLASELVRLAKSLSAVDKKQKRKMLELHPDAVKFLVLCQKGKCTQKDHDEYNRKHPEGIAFVEPKS